PSKRMLSALSRTRQSQVWKIPAVVLANFYPHWQRSQFHTIHQTFSPSLNRGGVQAPWGTIGSLRRKLFFFFF
ncbi:hypothetical protein NDU88_006385, partial [Pleurodeles waltl]